MAFAAAGPRRGWWGITRSLRARIPEGSGSRSAYVFMQINVFGHWGVEFNWGRWIKICDGGGVRQALFGNRGAHVAPRGTSVLLSPEMPASEPSYQKRKGPDRSQKLWRLIRGSARTWPISSHEDGLVAFLVFCRIQCADIIMVCLQSNVFGTLTK